VRQASLDATDRSVAPPKGLSTLGFDPARFQAGPPATGLPGDYPGRTCTGWRRRASNQVMSSRWHLLTAVRTHRVPVKDGGLGFDVRGVRRNRDKEGGPGHEEATAVSDHA